MVQAIAVIVIVIIKRAHDDAMHKDKPPSKTFNTILHYLRYPFFLQHLDYHQMSVGNEGPNDTETKFDLLVEAINGTENGTKELPSANVNTTDVAIAHAINGILNELKKLRQRKQAKQRQENIAEQWQKVAAMYDRILFVVFLMVVFAVSGWFLTTHPTEESQELLKL